MATSPADPAPRPHDLIWQAPLVPVALAFTAGIVLDRFVGISTPVSASAAAALLVACASVWRGPLQVAAAPLLWFAIAAAGAFYHPWRVETMAPDDIRLWATSEGRPTRLRGLIDSEPTHLKSIDEPLRTTPTKPATRVVVQVREVEVRRTWADASGLLQVHIEGGRQNLRVGDEVELVGRLTLPSEPANPGEFDYARFLRDQGIGATLQVPESPGAVEVVHEGWPRSFFGWLGALRGWANETIQRYLPKDDSGVAAALLLGDTSGMMNDKWDVYLRTGVIHVLAISGQHLAVLGWFLWIASGVLFMRRRPSALVISLALLGYALLTGGRPSVMRAAWMVIVYAGGIQLRRPVMPANVFAFAWLGVAVANPTDIFNNGCQVSFLAVAVIIWGIDRFKVKEQDPLERLIDESRSWITVSMLRCLRWLIWVYAVNIVIWLAVTPLVASRYHVVSPVALVIGPPLVLFSSLALLFGFGLLVTVPLLGPLATVFAALTTASLASCEWLVHWADTWPGSHVFVPDVPAWWLCAYYVGLLATLAVPALWRRRRVCAGVMLGWLALGCVLLSWPASPREFRCTFLAVGHGGCTVLETPGGQVILYDAGAITGPDVTRRHIAPFLWNRGYRRIDDVIISHGDLDHFNGLPALLERFTVRRVTLTPTFADRSTRGVHAALRALEKSGIETRIVHAPMQWEAGDVSFESLHPPARGPDGVENERSLVLAVRYRDLTILLTGDLEKSGLRRVLSLPPTTVDVVMAPHHGSATANTKEFAAWARPKLVVSCQAAPKSVPSEPNPYEAIGARLLTTWTQGAVTIQSVNGEWTAETFQTKGRWRLGR